jgi:hypothetical protein
MRLLSWANRLVPIVIVSFGLLSCDDAVQRSLAPRDRPWLDHTPDPTTVTVAGSLQSELGCSADWQPDCAATHLAFDAVDDVWQGTFAVPAGSWEYKAALDDSWDENYGANATENGANIALNLASATNVKFYYSHHSHWITSSANAVIATAAGSFQSELGCSGDWTPDCLRSWLQDPDGDGVYTFTTTSLPAGAYETKVAINEGWTENYGADGVANGANIAFTVPVDAALVSFTYTASTHVLSISVAGDGGGGDEEPSFGGFLSPGSGQAWNTVKGGQRVPISFTLGGDFGLDAFDSGYPKSLPIDCDTQQPLGTASATVGSLVYSADIDQYTYLWKTDKSWEGSCRLLVLKFPGSSEYSASFILH